MLVGCLRVRKESVLSEQRTKNKEQRTKWNIHKLVNGIVNYMVQVRRYDLGVKLAMGADNSRLLKDSLIELMQLVLMSLLFAFSLSFMLLGYSRTLPDISFTPDWLIVITLTLGFALLSLLVSFVPVSKILANDPITALRNE